MDVVALLQTQPITFIISSLILGLLIGSFLNVVIYRLPVMMNNEWQQQCHELLNLDSSDGSTEKKSETFNLNTPRSRCPKCNHKITALENIPVFSYLFLKGKCSSCADPISPRYALIELLTGVMTAVVAWHFGFSWQAGAVMLLTWALIAMSFIDIDHQLLPDNITLPWLWLGLLLSLFPIFVDTHTSLIGAAAGYLSLWGIFWLFKLVTGKEGMGYGDFKLLALLGAWMGWQLLPVVILLSSVVGAVIGIAMMVILGRDKNIPIPFGPYLAAAGWIAMLWGHDITEAYFTYTNL